MLSPGLVGATMFCPPPGRRPSKRLPVHRGKAPAVVLTEYVKKQAVTPGLVSIVIPTIGRPSIEAAIAALDHQSYRHRELVIVDDRERRGASRARNRGAAQASGEYLFFLDDDCILRPHALEHLVEALRRDPRAAFAYGWLRIGKKRVGGGRFDIERLRRRNFISTNSMVRATEFPGFDEGLHRWQDWELWLRIARSGRRGVFVDEKLLDTTHDPGGISGNAHARKLALEILRARHRVRI